jgi:hypothetical protein
MDLVQPAWYTGKLIVGESTAQGQCLFSSVAMLVFGRRDDYVAVWLRGLCQLELMAYWEQYLDWFGNETASDMQKTLVGNDGNDWPVAEVLWVLANLLQRRIVVVRKLNQRTSAAAGGDKPFVVLPVRHAVNGWVGEAPQRPLPAAACVVERRSPTPVSVWRRGTQFCAPRCAAATGGRVVQ